jgi:hypothetical protein
MPTDLLAFGARAIYFVLVGSGALVAWVTLERIVAFSRWRNLLSIDPPALQRVLLARKVDAAPK